MSEGKPSPKQAQQAALAEVKALLIEKLTAHGVPFAGVVVGGGNTLDVEVGFALSIGRAKDPIAFTVLAGADLEEVKRCVARFSEWLEAHGGQKIAEADRLIRHIALEREIWGTQGEPGQS